MLNVRFISLASALRRRGQGAEVKCRQPGRIFDAVDDELAAFASCMDSVTLAQSISKQVTQVTFTREMFGRTEDRIVEFAELGLHIAFPGDLDCVLYCVRRFD